MSSVRIERLQQVIKQRISEMVLYELKDPRVGFVTITRVKLTRDLSLAQVYYSVLGHEGDRRRTQEALDHARGLIQRAVAKALTTRVTPHLEFHYDESIEGMIRIDKILTEIKEEQEEREETSSGDGPHEDTGATIGEDEDEDEAEAEAEADENEEPPRE